MSLSSDINQLLKNKIIIRHRAAGELSGKQEACLICRRDMTLPPGSLCLAVGSEGLICNSCGEQYTPEMMVALGNEQPVPGKDTKNAATVVLQPTLPSVKEWIEIAQDIEELTEKTNDLARGISRGIVEAPAGHIGLMHYAKDFLKPPRKPAESEKEYELRIRTLRMAHLLHKIQNDTIGRINRITSFLRKLGMPDTSR